jgi:hypothetical protein
MKMPIKTLVKNAGTGLSIIHQKAALEKIATVLKKVESLEDS